MLSSPIIPIDLILSAWLGLLFAGCARLQFRDGAPPWGRELLAVGSFELMAMWPAAIYFYVVHPAWSWMYLVDPARFGTGFLILVLAALLATLLAGYGTGWWLIRNKREGILWFALGSTGIVMLLIALLSVARLGGYGSYAEFHAGHTLPITEVKLGWVLLACGLGVLASGGAVGWTLWAHGRRAMASSAKTVSGGSTPEGTEPSGIAAPGDPNGTPSQS